MLAILTLLTGRCRSGSVSVSLVWNELIQEGRTHGVCAARSQSCSEFFLGGDLKGEKSAPSGEQHGEMGSIGS